MIFLKSVKYFFPKHRSQMNIKDGPLARSLDPYGKLDLLPRTDHWLDPKSRACMCWNVASTTSYTIRSFGLFGYLRVVCLEIISVGNIHNSSQATMLYSQISLVLLQQTTFVPFTRYVKFALFDSPDPTD